MTLHPFRILVVDDEKNQRELLKQSLEDAGYPVQAAGSVTDALKALRTGGVDMVLSDYQLQDGTGEGILDFLQKENPLVPFILFTAFGSVRRAVDFMKKGAADYLSKPLDLEELEVKIRKIGRQVETARENVRLRRELEGRGGIAEMLFKSAVMEKVTHLAYRAAQTSATVLITGESGTGKELVARAIHRASPRREGPLVAVNCAALNENLLESELFGHEKGAFTGADRRRIGRFEEASGGTLFLDEIGEIAPSLQVKLLRVLQERKVQRMGSNADLPVDFRLIAATNRGLARLVEQGAFRNDLYYRLNVIHVEVPPLRERREDIPFLAEHFREKFAAENGVDIRGISRDTLHMLVRYDYPGNVRELENLIERAVVLAGSSILQPEDFPDLLPTRNHSLEEELQRLTLPDAVDFLEKHRIRKALEESSHVQTRAAELLGISEKNLRYKMEKYGIGSRRKG